MAGVFLTIFFHGKKKRFSKEGCAIFLIYDEQHKRKKRFISAISEMIDVSTFEKISHVYLIWQKKLADQKRKFRSHTNSASVTKYIIIKSSFHSLTKKLVFIFLFRHIC